MLPVTGPANVASLGELSGIAVDAAGNILFAASKYTAVSRLDTFGMLTLVAGDGTEGFSGDNGPATRARLHNYADVAVDGAGSVYISDNHRIRKVSNGVITTVVGNGIEGFSGDNGPALGAQLSAPSGVAVDAAGNLYISELGNSRVRKVSRGIITTVAGNGAKGFSGDNGPATSAALNNPSGLVVDAAGNLYIADLGNMRVRKVSNGVITTVAGGGGTPGCCFYPIGLALDGAGTLYIADLSGHRILKLSNGAMENVAGKGTIGFSGDNGPAIAAELDSPAGVAVDAVGNLYIADRGNYRIRKVSNGVITTVAGNGIEALSESEALVAPLPPDMADAYNLLLGKYKGGLIPDTAVNGILAELRAIKAAASDVAKVHDFGALDLREIIVRSVDGLLPSSLSAKQREAAIHRMALNPLATGVPGLDKLNKSFDAVKIDDHYYHGDTDGWLTIHFRKPLDIVHLIEVYRQQLGDHFGPESFIGDGDHIERIQKTGEALHYVFTIGRGDCPAGCTEHVYYHFNLYPEAKGFRVERVPQKAVGPAR